MNNFAWSIPNFLFSQATEISSVIQTEAGANRNQNQMLLD